ncbi:ABC transporter permease [Agrobacterium sp. ES01]|uniref:ABC transporter permease n=1 Tax=Agrobacterium sp. ES01 TaxID=3420714 RepID=UPI003D0F4084
MSALFSALGEVLAWIGHIIDPLCGPVGVFSLLDPSSLLACSDTGWGDEIAYGVKITVSLAVATLPVGLALGFLVALATQSREKELKLAAGIYTTIFRGLPELLTLFIIYYGLQIFIQSALEAIGIEARVEINSFVAGMIALSIVFSSYCSEVLQSAFKAIPNGQYEAGSALGLSYLKTQIFIVFPQLIRIAYPGLINLWMNLLKDTALVSAIGLSDIIRQTGVAGRINKDPFTFYLLACGLFLAIAVVSSIATSGLERWMKRSEAKR